MNKGEQICSQLVLQIDYLYRFFLFRFLCIEIKFDQYVSGDFILLIFFVLIITLLLAEKILNEFL